MDVMHRRLAPLALVAAGVAFLLYQVLRPYADETTQRGAVAAMGSPGWVVAHLLAVAGFVLLTFALAGLSRVLDSRAARWALGLTWAGAGLTLPYYGAEVFALNALAQRAGADRLALPELADAIRYLPAAIATFGAGLTLLAAGGVVTAVALWRAPRLRGVARWSGMPFALGLVAYLPQFFTPPPVRMVHGALLAAASLWVAVTWWRMRP